MAKTKISRPILYTIVAAAVIFAAVLLTEPDPPARKTAVRTRTSSAAPSGFTEADLTARFARYSARQQDAFRPGIVPSKAAALQNAPASVGPAPVLPGGAAGTWALTGITTVNTVRSALVENSATKESIFLKAGDRWNGLRVLSVESSAVVFANALGQQTRLTFVETAPTDAAAAARGDASAAPTGAARPSAAASSPSGTAVPAAPR